MGIETMRISDASMESSEVILKSFGKEKKPLPDDKELSDQRKELRRQFSFSKHSQTTDFMYNMERFNSMIEDNSLDYSRFTTSPPTEIDDEKKEAIIKLIFYFIYRCAKEKYFLTDIGFCVIYSLFNYRIPINILSARYYDDLMISLLLMDSLFHYTNSDLPWLKQTDKASYMDLLDYKNDEIKKFTDLNEIKLLFDELIQEKVKATKRRSKKKRTKKKRKQRSKAPLKKHTKGKKNKKKANKKKHTRRK